MSDAPPPTDLSDLLRDPTPLPDTALPADIHTGVQLAERLHREGMPVNEDTLGSASPGLLSQAALRRLAGSARFKQALSDRGIAADILLELTPHMLHALAVYLDTSTPMTHRERLRAAGVTQTKWDGWKRNPRFAARLAELSEERIADLIPVASLGLFSAADRGERWAIEMGLAITGRYEPGKSGADPQQLLMAVFDILDDEGVPPAVMRKVGARLRMLASGVGADAAVRGATNAILAASEQPATGLPVPAPAAWPVASAPTEE